MLAARIVLAIAALHLLFLFGALTFNVAMAFF
jgi:hypothetical protein